VRLVRPYKAERTFYIKAPEAGRSLAGVLHTRFPFRSEAAWTGRILEGTISVDGDPAKVKEGARVVHVSTETVEPSVPDLATCLKDNGNWSVWFKPAPLPMHAGGRYQFNTMEYIVKEKTGRPVYIIHRLDAVTSGLVLVAHDAKTAAQLTQQFSDRQTEKVYAAIVYGVPNQQSWQVNLPVKRKKGYVFEAHPDGQSAETNFEFLESDGEKSLVLCKPVTGRTHQIRVHLRACGHPIFDDPVYGAQVENPSDNILQNSAISLVHIGLRIPGMDIPALLGV
jgi:RluA family pseudouridine synthase